MDGFDAMTNPCCAQISDRLPHAFWPCRFTCVNGHMQSCISDLFKMLDKAVTGLPQFITCEIDCHNVIFLA
ncbi:Uncharacterised protein [Vibrio cholerae]|uniref:Uncharacterized protein n=1 Tax=Vibrio cholerae TaxID=666 RepID=A0A655U0V4_VIBCL|nr:Uncharacterised protein [Vibrio cholerae]CSA44233.1 Uncharacterised protein [Vibrio cholerae]CSB43059.1 Uncharacterised protein [Vibrio cholerae]CSC51030.1 Uncharacterised protein [Vibrio cholerae]